MSGPSAQARAYRAVGSSAPEHGQGGTSPDADAAVAESMEGVNSPSAAVAAQQGELQVYEQASLLDIPVGRQLQHESTGTLLNLMNRVAVVEGPVHLDVVIERIRERYGIGRVRGRTRENVEWVLREAVRQGNLQGEGGFVWLNDSQLERSPRVPLDRNIEHVAPTELATVVLTTARAMFGAHREELVVEVARRLGFNRTGPRITEVLGAVIRRLEDDDELGESFGMIRPQ